MQSFTSMALLREYSLSANIYARSVFGSE